MPLLFRTIFLIACVAAMDSARAGDPVEPAAANTGPVGPEPSKAGRLDVFEDGIGGILFPHLHLHGVAGASSADEGDTSAAHHDPRYDGFNFSQGLEAGFSLRAGDHVEGFATGALTWDRGSNDWDAELEEAFGKLHDLPGGFELRAGRYFNRFGRQNSLHAHGFDFVDQNRINGVLLGEHGLATDGAELSWNIPLPFPSILSAGFGRAVSSAHDHEHGHDDHPDVDPGHTGELDGLTVIGNLFSLRYLSRYHYNDFHRFSGGVSFARGGNGFDRDTSLFGVDVEYLWRENGLEPGGRALRWNTEFFRRRAGIRTAYGHESADGHHADEGHEHRSVSLHDETVSGTGVMTSLIWTASERWDAGFRAEWIDGHRGQPERWRLSPAITLRPDEDRRLLLRLQYNWDHSRESGDDHAVWLQFGLDFGGREVR